MDELLEMSRLEAGALELNALTIDLGDFVRMTVASFESLAGLKDVHLVASVPERAVPVHADPDKVEKVLYNLLSNAVKFAADSQRLAVTGDPMGRRFHEQFRPR